MISRVEMEKRCLEYFQNLIREGEVSSATSNEFSRKIIPGRTLS